MYHLVAFFQNSGLEFFNGVVLAFILDQALLTTEGYERQTPYLQSRPNPLGNDSLHVWGSQFNYHVDNRVWSKKNVEKGTTEY